MIVTKVQYNHIIILLDTFYTFENFAYNRLGLCSEW